MLKVSGDGRAAALDLRLALDEDPWRPMGEDLVLARPFTQAGQLDAARDRVARPEQATRPGRRAAAFRR
jgi:hypothetical protein